MNVKFACHTFNIKIKEDFNLGSVILSNDNNNLKYLLHEPSLIASIGNLGITSLISSPHFSFYGDSSELPSTSQPPEDFVASEYIHGYLESFFMCLWLVKDNSANIGLFYYMTESEPILRRHRNVYYSDAKGEYSTEMFSSSEFKKAELYLNLMSNLHEEPKYNKRESLKIYGMNPSPTNFLDHSSRNRVSRAFLFLNMARSTSYLPLKLSFHMSVLECLFTTDSSEVNHKISERTTLFLGGNRSEKATHWQTLKECYNVRSKFLHGQSFDKKKIKSNIDLHGLSVRIDVIIRKVLLKILESEDSIFIKSNEELEIFFMDLVLGDSSF